MGAGAIQRGDKLIRRQIDEQVEKGRQQREMLAVIERQQEDISRLRAELETTQQALAQVGEAYNRRGVYLNAEREFRAESDAHAMRSHDLYTAMIAAYNHQRRLADKRNAILLCVPEDVRVEAHEDAKREYPTLWER